MLSWLARRLAEIERRAARRRRLSQAAETWQRAHPSSPGESQTAVSAFARRFTGEALASLADLAAMAASEWVRLGAARELFARAGPCPLPILRDAAFGRS